MFTMFFLVKLTIAIVIVCGILSPILASPHNKLSTLFWKIPNAFWIFLICIYFAIAMAVLIESSEQTR
ncbi:pilJ, partial [Escherichia coli]|nr:pilJ [Escherichia coli]